MIKWISSAVILSIAFCVVMRNRAQARSAQLHQMAVMQNKFPSEDRQEAIGKRQKLYRNV